MFKRGLIVLCIATIVLSSIQITVFAKDDYVDDAFWVLSDNCPDEYFEYANKYFDDFIYSIEPGDYSINDDYTLGSPFNFGMNGDVFYYPVLCNGEIKFLFEVYPDIVNGSFAGAMSKELVTELCNLKKLTQNDAPLFINVENNTLIAYVGRSIRIELRKRPYTLADTVNERFNIGDAYGCGKRVVNILSDTLQEERHITGQMIEENYKAQNLLNSTKSLPSYMYLNTSITEHQTNLPWCAAYATAMIVRYRIGSGDSTTALDVMQHFYANPDSSNTIGEYAVCQYGAYRGLNPVYTFTTMANSVLANQIAMYQPVYLKMKFSTGDYYHAIVLRGYGNSGSFLSVWNPWDQSYTSFFYGYLYVPFGYSSSELYMTYEETVYNWVTDPVYPDDSNK